MVYNRTHKGKVLIKQKEISLLFVEDEVEIRKSYVEIFKQLFLKVYDAGDGETAYELYMKERPDIIIVDINLPGFNGLELVKKIRENDKNTKIIVLTAYSNQEFLLEATGLMLTKYLLKPVKRDALNNAIDLAINEINELKIIYNKHLLLKDGFRWNFKERCLYQYNKEIKLTKKEKDILNFLFTNPFRELTYDMIIESVWDCYDKPYLNSLKTMIMNIRKKLPKDTIQTLYGIGYRFEIEKL